MGRARRAHVTGRRGPPFPPARSIRHLSLPRSPPLYLLIVSLQTPRLSHRRRSLCPKTLKSPISRLMVRCSSYEPTRSRCQPHFRFTISHFFDWRWDRCHVRLHQVHVDVLDPRLILSLIGIPTAITPPHTSRCIPTLQTNPSLETA